MNDFYKDSFSDSENSCPECNFLLSNELRQKLDSGETIICERCGNLIEGIVKPSTSKTTEFSEKKKQKNETKSNGESDSWNNFYIEMKKNWEQFKKNWIAFWKKIGDFFRNRRKRSQYTTVNANYSIKTQSYTQEIIPKFDPITGKPLNEEDHTQIKSPKFDPFTGKPLKSLEIQNSLNGQIIDEKEIQINNERNNKKRIEEIYTVLDEDIREKLLKISISDVDRKLISKSLIYLTRKQQKKYLIEVENVNSEDTPELKKLIQEIKNLPIPQNQRNVLIEQLNFIPEVDQDRFIEALDPKNHNNDSNNSEKIEYDELNEKIKSLKKSQKKLNNFDKKDSDIQEISEKKKEVLE